jgi:hypothetical protein
MYVAVRYVVVRLVRIVRHDREMHVMVSYVSIMHVMATHVSGIHIRAMHVRV